MSRTVAIVTGASSGIGREFAEQLTRRGHHVLAVARRADLLEELAAGNPLIEPFPADVTDPHTIERILDRAQTLGQVELLVCNAGRGHFAPFHDADLKHHLDIISLNLDATVRLVHTVLPRLRRQGSGGIIVVSSNLGVVPTPNMAVYAATKAFLLSWTHALIHENRGSGVRFLALCPGPTISGFSNASGLRDQVERTPGATTTTRVVTDALRAWDKGRDSVVPGRILRFLTSALDAAPRPVGRRVMGRIFA